MSLFLSLLPVLFLASPAHSAEPSHQRYSCSWAKQPSQFDNYNITLHRVDIAANVRITVVEANYTFPLEDKAVLQELTGTAITLKSEHVSANNERHFVETLHFPGTLIPLPSFVDGVLHPGGTLPGGGQARFCRKL
jgi:hypothetical protein